MCVVRNSTWVVSKFSKEALNSYIIPTVNEQLLQVTTRNNIDWANNRAAIYKYKIIKAHLEDCHHLWEKITSLLAF
jgi:hypothetical protein